MLDQIETGETVESNKSAVDLPAPVAESAGVAQPEECPTFTLRADTRFGILAMVKLTQMTRDWWCMPPPYVPAVEVAAELEAKMREFELYEERTAPAGKGSGKGD